MRPGRLVVGLLAIAALGWIGWNSLGFIPEAWSRYRHGQSTGPLGDIDTTLFAGDSAVSSDTTTLSQDTTLTGLLARIGPELGVAKRSIGAVHASSGDLPLYSLVLRRGAPLPEIAARAIDSLASHGFTILESTEKFQGKWPWLCRLGQQGKPVAMLRAKIDADPAPGAFGLSLVVWSDTLDAGLLAAIPRLPRGSVLALPPRALSESRVVGMASANGIRLALLARIETSRLPAWKQEESRLLLHHKEDEIRKRLSFSSEIEPPPVGLVLIDGDRGAIDPDLTKRIAEFCQSRSLWILDATGAPASRISDAALSAGASVLPLSRPGGTESVAMAIEEAGVKAEQSGQSLLVWPFDSIAIERIGSDLPLLTVRGIEIRPPQPWERHEATGE